MRLYDIGVVRKVCIVMLETFSLTVLTIVALFAYVLQEC